MPFSALPKHLQDIENQFPDDSQFGVDTWYGRLYRWVNKKTKTWFAFSYRCTEWWAKTRKFPKTLFAIRGKGVWRIETEHFDEVLELKKMLILPKQEECYLSRCQYYNRWHITVQWPLTISAHHYPKAEDVPDPEEPRPDLDGKVLFSYLGHFDNDLIHWLVTSAYAGRNFK
jgi:hypothetical protein